MPRTESNSHQDGLIFNLADQESLWQHMVKKSHVRLGTKEDFKARGERIKTVELKVRQGSFSPHNLGFLSGQKSNGVPRFIPVLDIETTCVYFACVRAIDETCAQAAVPGTFGGWSLGGKRRKHEGEEVQNLIKDDLIKKSRATTNKAEPKNSVKLEKTVEKKKAYSNTEPSEGDFEIDDGSAPSSPYNKAAWVENWQQYWKVSALTVNELNEDNVILTLDIANFYDSVDHVRLLRLIKDKCTDQMLAIDVLEYLLTNWNKTLRFYQPNSKGLPMDMVGDMSRVLANFYLVEFDKRMSSHLGESSGKYLRWADDMTLVCANEAEAHRLVYFVAQELHSIGLNVNAAKVKIRPKSAFSKAWGFDVMDALQDDQDEGRLKHGLEELKNAGNIERTIARIQPSSAQ